MDVHVNMQISTHPPQSPLSCPPLYPIAHQCFHSWTDSSLSLANVGEIERMRPKYVTSWTDSGWRDRSIPIAQRTQILLTIWYPRSMLCLDMLVILLQLVRWKWSFLQQYPFYHNYHDRYNHINLVAFGRLPEIQSVGKAIQSGGKAVFAFVIFTDKLLFF